MTEKKIIIKGRKVVGGLVEGEALVSKIPTMGWRNIDYQRGVITERGHPLEGIPLKSKVFVFPTPRGSGGWSWYGRTSQYGTNPVAIVYWKGNALTVNGAMLMGVPTVGDCDQNPAEIIDTGDWVKVDADKGIVEIRKKKR
jgi:predicted aconitase with swiveling domain